LSREIGENSALAPTDILAALGERGIFLRKSANETSVLKKSANGFSSKTPVNCPLWGQK
jgi:lambda repressor-like predicted transcriptional regulator